MADIFFDALDAPLVDSSSPPRQLVRSRFPAAKPQDYVSIDIHDDRRVPISASEQADRICEMADGLLKIIFAFAFICFAGLPFAAPGQRNLQNNIEMEAGKKVVLAVAVLEFMGFGLMVSAVFVLESVKHIKYYLAKHTQATGRTQLTVARWTYVIGLLLSVAMFLCFVLSVIGMAQVKLGSFYRGGNTVRVPVLTIGMTTLFALTVYTTSHIYMIFATRPTA